MKCQDSPKMAPSVGLKRVAAVKQSNDNDTDVTQS
jgi:hypothetical protein